MNRNIPNPPVYIGQPYSNVTSGPYAQSNTVIPQPYSNVTSGPYAQSNTVIPQPYSNVTSGPYAQSNTVVPQPYSNVTSGPYAQYNNTVAQTTFTPQPSVPTVVTPTIVNPTIVNPTIVNPTIVPPSENVDTITTQDPKYKGACRSTVPIICGEKTPQAGYCRRNEHDCNFKEWKSKSKGKVDSYIYEDKDMKNGDEYIYRPQYNAPRVQSPPITDDESQRQKVLNSFNKYLSNDEVVMKNKYLKYKEKYNALKALMDELEEANAHEDELTQL
jgi:hypothetical protein